MTIGELIKVLQKFHDRTVVVVSKDAEGNQFKHIDVVSLDQAEYVGLDLPHSDVVVVIWPI